MPKIPIEYLQDRADGIRDWLKQNALPEPDRTRYLDEGGAARVYWHMGYRTALLDAVRLLKKNAH